MRKINNEFSFIEIYLGTMRHPLKVTGMELLEAVVQRCSVKKVPL